MSDEIRMKMTLAAIRLKDATRSYNELDASLTKLRARCLKIVTERNEYANIRHAEVELLKDLEKALSKEMAIEHAKLA